MFQLFKKTVESFSSTITILVSNNVVKNRTEEILRQITDPKVKELVQQTLDQGLHVIDALFYINSAWRFFSTLTAPELEEGIDITVGVGSLLGLAISAAMTTIAYNRSNYISYSTEVGYLMAVSTAVLELLTVWAELQAKQNIHDIQQQHRHRH